MNCTPIVFHDDSERVYVHAAVVSVLAQFVMPEVPWIWILGHRPKEAIQWWDTTLALNERGTSYSGQVRDLAYDLQMPTAEFLARATEFDDHGIALIQSYHRMPDTLRLENVRDQNQSTVLKQNGAVLRIWLPHAIETAMVECFVPGYLGKTIAH